MMNKSRNSFKEQLIHIDTDEFKELQHDPTNQAIYNIFINEQSSRTPAVTPTYLYISYFE